MESKQYQVETAVVDRDEKSMKNIINGITDQKARLIHHAIGLGGEGGEVLDAVKKHVFYNQPLDTENLVEECGDILWYMTRLLDAIGMTLEDAMAHNNAKLRTRYPEGYSDEAAKTRLDKQQ